MTMEAKRRRSDPDHDYIVECGKRVVAKEKDGIAQMEAAIGADFVAAVHCVLACKGRVIVVGVGKSGHVGKKIAASMASTGTPAFFVHGDEALHGDLGMISAADVVILLSNSGETREVVCDLPSLKQIGAKLIAVTSNADSTLAKASDIHLCIGRLGEADHLGLAPFHELDRHARPGRRLGPHGVPVARFPEGAVRGVPSRRQARRVAHRESHLAWPRPLQREEKAASHSAAARRERAVAWRRGRSASLPGTRNERRMHR